jgi:hypothetical protein
MRSLNFGPAIAFGSKFATRGAAALGLAALGAGFGAAAGFGSETDGKSSGSAAGNRR